eukprot:1098042-Rhodomonas_salina.4
MAGAAHSSAAQKDEEEEDPAPHADGRGAGLKCEEGGGSRGRGSRGISCQQHLARYASSRRGRFSALDSSLKANLLPTSLGLRDGRKLTAVSDTSPSYSLADDLLCTSHFPSEQEQ